MISPEDKNLHRKFQEYGRNVREWTRKCVLLLPEIDRRQVWRKKKFSSIYEYAAKLAGMSRDTVNDALRILRKIEDRPLIKQVVEEKGINAVKPVVNLLTSENEKFWAEKAKEMSKNTLQTYVKDFRQNYRLDGRAGPSEQPVKVTISMELNSNLAAQLQKIKGDMSWEELMFKFLEWSSEKIEFKTIGGARPMPGAVPLPVQSKYRYIPVAIRKYVVEKSGGMCAYPTCFRRSTSIHHINRFWTDHIHDPKQMVALCDAHERMAHLGLIKNEESVVHNWGVLKEVDKSNPKFYTDRTVQAYRMAHQKALGP